MDANTSPQDLWKLDDPQAPHPLAAMEICSLARQRERAEVWGRRIGIFALAGFIIAFIHNTWQIDQPWVRLGQGWMLIVSAVYLWGVIRKRTGRRDLDETCAQFLLRSLILKRNGFLAIRRAVLMIIPAILASWWGGGAALKARAMGLDPSSPYYAYLTSVWPIIATCALLLIVWFGFTSAAKKASAEFETLQQRIAV